MLSVLGAIKIAAVVGLSVVRVVSSVMYAKASMGGPINQPTYGTPYSSQPVYTNNGYVQPQQPVVQPIMQPVVQQPVQPQYQPMNNETRRHLANVNYSYPGVVYQPQQPIVHNVSYIAPMPSQIGEGTFWKQYYDSKAMMNTQYQQPQFYQQQPQFYQQPNDFQPYVNYQQPMTYNPWSMTATNTTGYGNNYQTTFYQSTRPNVQSDPLSNYLWSV